MRHPVFRTCALALAVIATTNAEAVPPAPPVQDVNVINTTPVPVTVHGGDVDVFVANELVDVAVPGKVVVTGPTGGPVLAANGDASAAFQVQLSNEQFPLDVSETSWCAAETPALRIPAGYRFVIQTMDGLLLAPREQPMFVWVQTGFRDDFDEAHVSTHYVTLESAGGNLNLHFVNDSATLYTDGSLCVAVDLDTTIAPSTFGYATITLTGYLVRP